jgi:hypothetical protein
MRLKVGCYAFLALLLAGCSTPYQKSSGFKFPPGGYEEQQLEPGIWRVGYSGNGYTSRESVQTYWLYRCAELSLEHGADGFEIISRMPLAELRGTRHAAVQQAASGPIYVPMITPGASSFPHIEGDIRLLKKPLRPTPSRVYEAATLKSVLDPLVTGSKCGIGNVCPHVHHYLYEPMPSPDEAKPPEVQS